MEEWKSYTLSELSIDGKGAYGIGAPAVEYSPEKYKYLRITDINDDGTLAESGRMSVDSDGADNYVLKENDIVFARTGNSTGRTYFYDSRDGELVYAGFLIKFSIDPSKVNPKILKYYTHSKPYYDWVRSFDSGATRGNINAQTFASMPIELPNRDIQDKIVNILSSLDEKIRNNNRINHNLEEQAQALYRSWFVDFEPFKDGEFVESELGMIPKGWDVKRLGQIATIEKEMINPQKYPTTIFSHYSIPAYDNSEAPEIQSGSGILSNKFVLTDKSVMFSKLNPRIKRVWNIYSAKKNAICSTEFVVYKALNNQDYGLLYAIVSGEYFYDTILAKVNGATGSHQRFHPDETLDIMFPYSPLSCKKYGEIVLPIIQQIENNNKERIRLMELRESILPKLMSGDLNINGIDC